MQSHSPCSWHCPMLPTGLEHALCLRHSSFLGNPERKCSLQKHSDTLSGNRVSPVKGHADTFETTAAIPSTVGKNRFKHTRNEKGVLLPSLSRYSASATATVPAPAFTISLILALFQPFLQSSQKGI